MQASIRKLNLLLIFVFLLSAVGCTENSPKELPVPELTNSTHNPEFDSELLSIAGKYLKFAMVNKYPNVAPTRCFAPPAPPMHSQSDDVKTHGSKLYFLFAENAIQYEEAATTTSPIGQTVVKEAWTADELNPNEKMADEFFRHESGRFVSKKLERGAKAFTIGEQQELYIMFKTDPSKPSTDQGWVYGVVSADGKQVVAGGKLENCMSCHRDAGVDRLFGPVQ